ncbi:MAG: class I tRNA ligase family protein, partial [Methanomicrobium sp.]|nr:class I tRNA ligase family protein [Methanomicrobium sp.]
RIFATPIPVWFCNKCGEVILPEEADLPVDPTSDLPKKPCPKCGSTEFTGEKDVLDTWMDSSISVLNVTGWDGSGKPALFPAQIRPQGHDIIRTWAFYTILRAGALIGEKPWEEILVNGMVLGDDGFKMSKSRGNIISPEEVIAKHGADAFRQWSASGAATGQDIVFSWNDVIAAARFQTKMWNICRFVLMQLEKGEPEDDSASVLADRWLMDKLSKTEKDVTECMNTYNFTGAVLSIREFARESFADNYIELVKGRLYGDGTGRGSARFALRTSIDALCRMLAPFTPFFAEECYASLTGKSVHTESWVDFEFEDISAREQGDLLVKVVSEVRRYKHDAGLALNAPLGHVVVYTPYSIDDCGDASSALNANLEWKCEKPKLIKSVSDVKFNFGVIGPKFRKQANAYMNAIRALSEEEKITPPKTVIVEGAEAEVLENSFEPVYSYSVAGETVEVLTLSDDVIVTVQKKE